jgi:superfamily II DNA or RNA helicase
MTATHYRSKHWIKQGVFDDLASFRDLEDRIDAIEDPKDRGDIFEIFIEAYLETQPIHQCVDHWVVGDVPLTTCEDLNLPNDGTGIDGVYQDRLGNYIPYQVKYLRADQLPYKTFSTFYGVVDPALDQVLFTNAKRLSPRTPKRAGVRLHLADQFHSLSSEQLRDMEAWLKRKPVRRERATPDPAYQTQVLSDIKATLKSNDRATVVMACGTGKTLISLWAVEQAKPKTVLVVVPTLLLLKQTLEEWSKHTNVKGGFQYLCVCSDKSVGLRNDEAELDAAEAGFRIDTDPGEVRRFLEHDSAGMKVVFTTYQSSPVVGGAVSGLPPFDIAILDEAHKTTGRAGTSFSFALSDNNLPIRKRLYLTATPRHYNIKKRDEEGNLVYASMDDEAIYGPRAHTLSFAAAIKLGVICPYKVIITLIDKQMVDDFVLKHGITLVDTDLVSARWVANLIAIERAVVATGAKKALTFHSRVAAAEEFAGDDAQGVGRYLPDYDIRHVNGKQRTSDRQATIVAFRDAPAGVLTNARCLTEGIDVPAIDMVAFIDPRRSRVDIAQAVGRAMRKPRGDAGAKTAGYIVVPLFAGASDDQTLEEAIHSEAFDEVADVINALQEHDEDLVDIISEMRRKKGEGLPIDRDRLLEKVSVVGPEVDLDQLMDSISIEISDRLGNNWNDMYGRLVHFKTQTDHCLVPARYEDKDGYRLGGWVGKQRQGRDALSPDRYSLLDEIGFVWDPFKAAWDEGYEYLRAYKEREDHCRVPQYYKNDDGFRLGGWVSAQRGMRTEILPERATLLDEIGFVWNKLEDDWREGYESLKAYKELHGHCLVPKRYKDEDGFKLGQWVGVKRKSPDMMSLERVALLNQVGFIWDAIQHAWEEGYEHLKSFKDQKGHCRVPRVFKSNDGYKLGTWVGNLRVHRDRLTPESIASLDSLGFIWDPFDENWNKGHERLVSYLNKTGNCRVPTNYKDEDGFKLGSWVATQRQNRSALLSKRVALLDEIGFVWNKLEDDWRVGYQRLKAYKELNGNCRVTQTYKDQDGFRLGNWVGVQRSQGKTTPTERLVQLNDLGFIWDIEEDRWNEGYEHLKDFVEHEGHCLVPSQYKNNASFGLGYWVGDQRGRRDATSPERVTLLDELGFVWNVEESAWNEGYEHMKNFVERVGHCVVPKVFKDKDGFKLGQWVGAQRKNKKKMPLGRVDLLDVLGFVWKVKEEAWDEGYGRLRAFVEREGHCLVPRGYEDEDGFQLGGWVGAQRQRQSRLSSDRIALFNELGFVWNPLVGGWNKGYERFSLFVEKAGHSLVPATFRDDDGFRLGQWIGTQRRNRAKTSPERVALLDELGMVWDPMAKAWNGAYERLKSFQEREGHCQVLQHHREEDGFKLGIWVSRQRGLLDDMATERRALLDDIGFIWKA